MRKYIILFVFILILYPTSSYSYDDVTTHPIITEEATRNADLYFDLKNYLINNLGFQDGFNTKLGIMGEEQTITEWLQQGSIDEDKPLCRASNHFHNPLLDWDKSEMSDHPALIDAYCAVTWGPWYSNVTWATGFKSRNGDKVTFDDIRLYLYGGYHGWDTARDYFYKALTETEETERILNYISTFNDLGHVVHLIQDTSVPSHVRNDFTSHLTWYDSFKLNFTWRYQPYERYVKHKPTIIANTVPVLPSFVNSTMLLTDFWDTDAYTGSNPSTSTDIGLAEYTNANYFSENTIPNNNPDDVHKFDNPKINSSDYEICTGNATNQSGLFRERKYIKKKGSSGCLPVLAVRILMPLTWNPEYDDSNLINVLYKVPTTTEDENVFDAYAKELIPRAVGYSAGLLNYFFRGQMEVITAIADDPEYRPYAIFSNGAISSIRLIVKNRTPDEAMEGGELVVTYEYRPDAETVEYGTSNPVTINETNNGTATINSGDISKELVFDFAGASRKAIDVEKTTFRVVYKGKLGNEEGAVAVSKPFNPVKYSIPAYVNYTDGNLEVNVGGQTYSEPISGYLNGSFIKVRFAEGNPDIIGVLVKESTTVDYVVHRFDLSGGAVTYAGEVERTASQIERAPVVDVVYDEEPATYWSNYDAGGYLTGVNVEVKATGIPLHETIRKEATDIYISNNGSTVNILGRYSIKSSWTQDYLYDRRTVYYADSSGSDTFECTVDGNPECEGLRSTTFEKGIFINDTLNPLKSFPTIFVHAEDYPHWMSYYPHSVLGCQYHPSFNKISSLEEWGSLQEGTKYVLNDVRVLSADTYAYRTTENDYVNKTFINDTEIGNYTFRASLTRSSGYSLGLYGSPDRSYSSTYGGFFCEGVNGYTLVTENNDAIIYDTRYGAKAYTQFNEAKCMQSDYGTPVMGMSVPYGGSDTSDVTFKRLP